MIYGFAINFVILMLIPNHIYQMIFPPLILPNQERNILKDFVIFQCNFVGYAIFLRIDGVLPIILTAR